VNDSEFQVPSYCRQANYFAGSVLLEQKSRIIVEASAAQWQPPVVKRETFFAGDMPARIQVTAEDDAKVDFCSDSYS
jgi:hypothetical protein